MSRLGQKRRFERRPIASGLPPTPDILGVRRHVSKVPTRDSCTAENRISIRSPRFQHGDRFIDATDHLIGDERDFINDKISSSVLRLEPARLRLAMGPTVKPRGDGQAHSKKPVKSALRIDILYISY
jgi:hypothetical protein